MPESSTDPEIASRTFWSGTITFGLVSIPVNLLPAHRSSGPSFRMVSEEGTPLSRRYFTSSDNRPLSNDEIVRGYEIEKGQFVVVSDDELERLAPERTRDIDLRVFVDVHAIDPMHFERAYYLTPAGGSTKAYRLLAQVMEEAGRAGIATFVMRAKEYLVAILAEKGVLRAETLRFADEVRTPDMIGLPAPVEPKATDVKRFEKEIEKLTQARFDPKELVDPSNERVLKLVNKKVKAGKDVVQAPEPEEDDGTDVIDLMEMLQRSLQGGDRNRGGKKAKAPAGGSEDLHGLSKAELYERAQELDIPGRSGMSKTELIRALRSSA